MRPVSTAMQKALVNTGARVLTHRIAAARARLPRCHWGYWRVRFSRKCWTHSASSGSLLISGSVLSSTKTQTQTPQASLPPEAVAGTQRSDAGRALGDVPGTQPALGDATHCMLVRVPRVPDPNSEGSHDAARQEQQGQCPREDYSVQAAVGAREKSQGQTQGESPRGARGGEHMASRG